MQIPQIYRTVASCTLTLLVAAVAACSDAEPVSADAGMSAVDANSEPSGDGANGTSVPSNTAELFSFLQARAYSQFDSEPAVHASQGPHGQVRSYFNPLLSSSLSMGQAAHPVGSATVKELYSGGQVTGWAVMVKTGNVDAASDWYFYEIFSTTDGSNPVAAGNGLGGCAGCHSSGTDYILTSFP